MLPASATRAFWVGGTLALMFALVVAYVGRPGEVHAQAANPARAGATQPTPVVIATATRTMDTMVVQAVGTSQALRSATLQPAVAGEVVSVHFEPGQTVRQGQRLMQLRDRKERLAADLATAELDNARQRVERVGRTKGTGAVAGSVTDDAENALRRAKINLAQAQEVLAEMTLKAPFDGVAGLLQVDPGNRVTPDTVITTLDDRSRLLVGFDLPETYLAQVQPGHAVRLTSVAFPGRVFAGQIVQIDNRVAPDTRSLRLRAEVPNDDDVLRPGMSFDLSLALTGEVQTEVPDLALQWGREGSYVWVVRDGLAVSVPVRLVRRLEGTVLIDGDLQEGEQVVVEGVQRLRPGRAVSIVEAAP